jgi:hypothetical protein
MIMIIGVTTFLVGMSLIKLKRRNPDNDSVIFKEATIQGCLAVGLILMGYSYFSGELHTLFDYG